MAIKKATITDRVYTKIFGLLERNPSGMRWVDLRRELEKWDETLHPKTVNGLIWKMIERFPDQVYNPSKGVFRLLKYKE